MISAFDFFNILENFFYVLIEWGDALYNFLFNEIKVLGFTFVPFYALPVVGIAILIINFVRN